jgi:hypothetical protein
MWLETAGSRRAARSLHRQLYAVNLLWASGRFCCLVPRGGAADRAASGLLLASTGAVPVAVSSIQQKRASQREAQLDEVCDRRTWGCGSPAADRDRIASGMVHSGDPV